MSRYRAARPRPRPVVGPQAVAPADDDAPVGYPTKERTVKPTPRHFSIACALPLLACSVDADVHDDDFEYSFREGADDSSGEPTLQEPDDGKQAPQLQLLLSATPIDLDGVFLTATPRTMIAATAPGSPSSTGR
jgi:hypothetical protein